MAELTESTNQEIVAELVSRDGFIVLDASEGYHDSVPQFSADVNNTRGARAAMLAAERFEGCSL